MSMLKRSWGRGARRPRRSGALLSALLAALAAAVALTLLCFPAQAHDGHDGGAPAKPTGLDAEVSHDAVRLTWNDPQDESISGYVILRRDKAIHAEGSFATVNPDTGSQATSYTDHAVEPEKQYVYRIRAISEHGLGRHSGEVAVEMSAAKGVDARAAAPEITSTAPYTVAEGSTAVATLSATDADTDPNDLTWSKTGGADQAVFTLSSGGVLAFASAKDYETPDDADSDGSYEVSVQVSDGTNSDTADLVVTLQNVIELETTISGPTTVSFAENDATRVASFSASSDDDRDGLQWTISGADAQHFTIDTPPGALRFHIDPVSPNIFAKLPDFEDPDDSDADNSYSISLQASAGSAATSSLALTVYGGGCGRGGGDLALHGAAQDGLGADCDAHGPGRRQRRYGHLAMGTLVGAERLDGYQRRDLGQLRAGRRGHERVPARNGDVQRRARFRPQD